MGPQPVVLMGIAATGAYQGKLIPVLVSAAGALETTGGGSAAQLPTVFKVAVAFNAGLTLVWQPASGKKFNLMGYQISASGTLAAADSNAIGLYDGNALTHQLALHFATMQTAVTGDTQIGVDYNGGYITSLAVNNGLYVNLGDAITNADGGVAVNAWGFEA